MTIDEIKLSWCEKKFGKMSSTEALQLAIEAEQYVKDLGPFDIATPMFIQQQIDFENYAFYLEKAGR